MIRDVVGSKLCQHQSSSLWRLAAHLAPSRSLEWKMADVPLFDRG